MLEKSLQISEELSSDQNQPFVGKYHGLLRRRRVDSTANSRQDKKDYQRKLISRKTMFWLLEADLLEKPLPFHHVFNFHNILAINEHSLVNPDCEESLILSKFYMKKIKKVSIQHNCLLFSLEDLESQTIPIPYMCERLKSMGNSTLMRIADSIEALESAFPSIEKRVQQQSQNGQGRLSQFLQQMSSKPFFSQYSSSMLIISGSFLQLLGYDMETMAIESIKHKSILQEFFSASNYPEIIIKHLQNFERLKEYFEGRINLEECIQESVILWSDYIHNYNHKVMKCQFSGGTSKQLRPFIELTKVISEYEKVQAVTEQTKTQRKTIEKLKDSFNIKEIGLLRNLIEIPRQLDPVNKARICSYEEIPTACL